MSKADRAAGLYAEGFSCSQAVFTAFSEDFGLARDASLRLAQPFGGGMAHLGQMCGAVTGAFMAIGLKHGRTRAEDLEARDRTYALQNRFAAAFKELHGSLSCPGLLDGLDLGTCEGMALARERNLFKTRCASYVRSAAEILDGIL
jgi:C_GCAxxG_C_C family probable redox protein